MSGRPHGEMRRDFTYVADLVQGIRLLMDAVPPAPGGADATAPGGEAPAEGDSLSPVAPFRVVNIGNGDSVPLMDFIAAIERAAGREAVMDFQPMQPGDVPATWADNSLLRHLTGYAPRTSVEDGVRDYVAWFRGYYGG